MISPRATQAPKTQMAQLFRLLIARVSTFPNFPRRPSSMPIRGSIVRQPGGDELPERRSISVWRMRLSVAEYEPAFVPTRPAQFCSYSIALTSPLRTIVFHLLDRVADDALLNTTAATDPETGQPPATGAKPRKGRRNTRLWGR
jgi:hypothetical protein